MFLTVCVMKVSEKRRDVKEIVHFETKESFSAEDNKKKKMWRC